MATYPMATYTLFRKENYSDLLNFAKKFESPDRKGKKQKTIIIVLEKFENKENNENKEKIYKSVERNKEGISKEGISKEGILNGLLFEKFSIGDIRKNLSRIIFCKSTNDKNELTKYNEIDVITDIASSEIMTQILCKNMHKNFISLAFDFSEILNSWGMQRVKKLAIMKKNFQLVKKYKVNYIISTFASNIFEYKPTAALRAFGKILGMNDEESRNAVSKNFDNIVKKFNDRNDENLLTDGLKVLKFGSIKKEKKKYGYY